MKIKVGVSNHHVHLTKKIYEELFNKDHLEELFKLNQKGEFASTDVLDIKNGDKVIKSVRVVGPFRENNQVELLESDLKFLNLKAPVRRSGVLDNTPGITLINKDKSIEIESGVIRAERHVHVPTKDSESLNLYERDKVLIKTNSIEFYAVVKVSDNGYFELHIDKDEALEYGLENGDEVDLVKCGK